MILTITNQKGGVGKSTTAQCLSIGLAQKNKKVLLIDFDPQRNLTFCFNLLNNEYTILDVLRGNCNIKQAIHSTNGINIIPSDIELNNADNEFTKSPMILKDVLNEIKNDYDFIIIDTPPTLSSITYLSLIASDNLIIPLNADIFGIQGLTTLANKINIIKQGSNPSLNITGILLTKFNERTILNRDVKEYIENVAKQLDTKLFKTYIRESVAVRESQLKKQCVLEYSPKNNVSKDYLNFINEFLKEVKK